MALTADDQFLHCDHVLRAYLIDKDFDLHPEAELKRKFVMNEPTNDAYQAFWASFPYIFKDEWEPQPGRTHEGKGDLLCTVRPNPAVRVGRLPNNMSRQ